MALSLKSKAPDFTLSSTTGKPFNLSKNARDQPLIIYFYPKDFTRVCTKEACSFKDNFSFFRDLDILVLGISTDSREKHHKFKKEYDLPFDLLSDPKGKVSKLYDAKMPFLNISKRITYLLDEDHKIVAAFSDLFGSENHIQEMINKLKR